MKLQKKGFVLAAGLLFALNVQAKQTFCVFDVAGKAGDAYALMKDYALEAKKWGADLDVKVYNDERVATEDFKAKRCDGVAISGLRGRQFNSFTGSIDAPGALPSLSSAIKFLQFLSRPQFAKEMVRNDYEVVGLIPIGAAYIFVNDRSINTVAKAAGKKIAVLDFDQSQKEMVQKLGAQPVTTDILSAGPKFNNGQVDIIAAPAVAFKPLELYRGLGTKGAIYRFPLAQITGNLIIHKDRFPDDYGQKSRTYVASQLPRATQIIGKLEKDIPAKYWLNVPKEDHLGYIKLMREARIDLMKSGRFDKRVLGLMKKIRCSEDPQSFECPLNDE
ncbi:putative solute-binding protein [Acinetobacter chinensis]|uniref:putative solute-binding protein n=1 Tax=Acinetobacter chinensis TaxID=2004650 RepID=UPI0029344E3D|nr:putative solute-binding protein [Acinetobacter chinensis]WOE41618.1 DUF6091 family protein [Acinetobacter chinensis]